MLGVISPHVYFVVTLLSYKLLSRTCHSLSLHFAVEGRGGGGGQVESFFGQLRNYYKNIKVVEDEWLPADQSLQYVNLALAPFKLGLRRAHEVFVDAVKEGVDNVYTDRSDKIECEKIAIPLYETAMLF